MLHAFRYSLNPRALVWLEGSMGVALVALWWRFRVALRWL
jgi:hypothetical protein